MAPTSRLFYGDNLKVLRSGAIAPGSIDLVYLDPPFNSDRVYNVIFPEKGENSQIQAFDDTWKWTNETDLLLQDLTSGQVPLHVAEALEALHGLLGTSNLMAYLINMTPRLVELHKALKPTGSLYLHCDPTASHYLKLMLDQIFGAKNFRNEIIWRRTGAHSPRSSFGPLHDTILFYTKTKDYYFKVLRNPYTKEHVRTRYKQQADGRWKFTSGGNVLTGAKAGGGESSQPWRGFDPAAKDRHWAIPGFINEQLSPEEQKLGVLDKLEAAYQRGLIDIVEGNAWPTPVRFLRPGDGTPVGDIWSYQPGTKGVLAETDDPIDLDVAYLGPSDPERLGYPTQKPVGLLERIIRASCPEDGVVLDPFCGCGTTLDAANRLGREWVGIDITYIAIDLIRNRLEQTFGVSINETYDTLGVPADLAAAHALFARSPFDFERWAVSLVRGTPNEKQVGDKGSDGVVQFATGRKDRARAVVSVKGGKQLGPSIVRDLEGVVFKTAKAEVGILITLHTPTKGMRDAAATSGVYVDPFGNPHPRVQMFTVEELLGGKKPSLPPVIPPYTEAKRQAAPSHQLTLELPDETVGSDELG